MAMAILSLVMAGTMGVFMQAQHALFVSTQKGNINRDMRTFTAELANVARNSNHFYIYGGIDLIERNEVIDRRTEGSTGDLLVLVFQEPYPNLDDPTHITRIVAYYRDASATEKGPIRKWEVDYTPSNYQEAAANPIESLLPTVSEFKSGEKVVELSEGLADGNLFLNFEDRSIMVKGQIYHGNDYKRLTDTYNFTITPRG